MIYQLSDSCVCGHTLNYHCDHTDIGLGYYCVGRLNPDCKCLEFRLDNLRYLEECSEHKTRVS